MSSPLGPCPAEPGDSGTHDDPLGRALERLSLEARTIAEQYASGLHNWMRYCDSEDEVLASWRKLYGGTE